MKAPKITKVTRVKKSVNLAQACNISRNSTSSGISGYFTGWTTKGKGINVR